MNPIDRWKDLLTEARAGVAEHGRRGRVTHALRDVYVRFEEADVEGLLLDAVRDQDWYYPSNEELSSIMLDNDDQHLYSFAARVHEQLPGIIALLEESPATRRAVLQLAHIDEYSLGDAYVPCLLSIAFHVADGALHSTTHGRSIDLFIGLPANIYQLSVLTAHIAERLGLRTGSVAMFINNGHVYDEYAPQLDAVLRNA